MISSMYMGGNPKIGVPQNIQNGWFMTENPSKMDDFGGKPTILGNPHIPFKSTFTFFVVRLVSEPPWILVARNHHFF